MKIKIPSIRLIYGLGFLLIALLLGITFYLQKQGNITPCPLCILQRFSFALLGLTFFFGAMARYKKITGMIIGIFASLLSLSGVLLAGRQVWLQHLPANLNEDCGVSFQYLMQALPFQEVVKKVLQGTAECSHVGAHFLYLSFAEWSLLWFIYFLFVSLYQTWRTGK